MKELKVKKKKNYDIIQVRLYIKLFFFLIDFDLNFILASP